MGKNRVTREDPLRSKGLKELGSKPCEYVGELCSQQRTADSKTLLCLRNSKEFRENTTRETLIGSVYEISVCSF